MRQHAHRTLAAAALFTVVASAAGDIDRTSWASRYSDYRKQQTHKWVLAKTTNSLTGLLGLGNALTNTVNRLLRYQIRVTAGHINPTNTPVFGNDLVGRAQQLDTQIGISDAHLVATGNDVVVAVLDSGFNLHHPAIAARVLPYGFDPVGGDWNPQDRGNGIDDDQDGYTDNGVGHGTFVSGMVLAAAPNAWILPVRIADDEGYCLESEVVAGLDFAISMGADVINLSFEAGTLSTAICAKLHQANASGITVVVSAGNDASEQTKALAEDGTTLSVGAVDDDDHVAPFSNTPSDGRGLTLLAPGVDLFGPHGGPANATNCTWSGTSFSAPLASGAAALALEVNPGLTPLQVRDRLLIASIAPVQAWNGSTYPYAGRLDLRRVVNP